MPTRVLLLVLTGALVSWDCPLTPVGVLSKEFAAGRLTCALPLTLLDTWATGLLCGGLSKALLSVSMGAL